MDNIFNDLLEFQGVEFLQDLIADFSYTSKLTKSQINYVIETMLMLKYTEIDDYISYLYFNYMVKLDLWTIFSNYYDIREMILHKINYEWAPANIHLYLSERVKLHTYVYKDLLPNVELLKKIRYEKIIFKSMPTKKELDTVCDLGFVFILDFDFPQTMNKDIFGRVEYVIVHSSLEQYYGTKGKVANIGCKTIYSFC